MSSEKEANNPKECWINVPEKEKPGLRDVGWIGEVVAPPAVVSFAAVQRGLIGPFA